VPSSSTTIVARSRPNSVLTQPRQLPASSLTSAICFSPASPSSGDVANAAARNIARYHLIADLLRATDAVALAADAPQLLWMTPPVATIPLTTHEFRQRSGASSRCLPPSQPG